mgnify:CR=1 FL=1
MYAVRSVKEVTVAERAAGRRRLDRARVLAEAVAFADAEGLDALTIRALAARLGVVPMALYKHVADKDDLLAGMVDHVIAEFTAGPSTAIDTLESVGAEADSWQGQVRRLLWAARRVVAAHPWARRAIETRTVRTAAVLGHMDRLTRILLEGGLSADLAHHAMHALGNRIWGFSPELFNDPGHPGGSGGTTGPVDPAAYPGIVAVAQDAMARRPGALGCDEDYEFGFALDLLLAGIDRLHRSGWSSPHPGRGTMAHVPRPSSLDPAIAALLTRDPAGLVAAIVQQHDTGEVLMLGWMDDEALHRTLTTGRVTFWSRSRAEYWRKGDTSGHVQYVHSVALDCDGDALLVRVEQVGAACHTGERTCFEARPLPAFTVASDG